MTVVLDDPAVVATVAEEWYVESSALVKLFVIEERSLELIAWLDGLEQRGGAVLVSDLGRTEVYRAVVRVQPELSGTVGPLLDDLAGVRLSERDLVHARVLQPMTVRTLDALHLAIVLGHEGRTAGIVTYDARIVEAAGMLGIRTVSP